MSIAEDNELNQQLETVIVKDIVDSPRESQIDQLSVHDSANDEPEDKKYQGWVTWTKE